MVLGYLGNADWRDMSDYLAHFSDTEAQMISILQGARVQASGPWGAVWNQPRVPNQASACFSEIPLDHLGRLVDRHGRFGVVFRKDLVGAAGGQRVWYVDKDSSVGRTLFSDLVQSALFADRFDATAPIWTVTPFIDYLMDGRSGGTRREFEWEREWRVVGGFGFGLSEVDYVFAPQERHEALKPYLTNWTILLDSAWPMERLQSWLT